MCHNICFNHPELPEGFDCNAVYCDNKGFCDHDHSDESHNYSCDMDTVCHDICLTHPDVPHGFDCYEVYCNHDGYCDYDEEDDDGISNLEFYIHL